MVPLSNMEDNQLANRMIFVDWCLQPQTAGSLLSLQFFSVVMFIVYLPYLVHTHQV